MPNLKTDLGPRTSPAPSAFTLIELLTVIAIIGILAAILIPVVGKVRETARRGACTSNIRQIAVAMHLYHDDHGRFPDQNDGSYMTLAGKRGNGTGQGGQYLADATQRPLNPYLDVPGGPDVEVPVAHCPSDEVMYDRSGSSYAYPNIHHFLTRPGPPGELGIGVSLENIENPARVLMVYEVNAALIAQGGGSAEFRFHDEPFRYNVASVSGHVRFLEIEPGRRITDQYSFYWNR